MTRVNATPRPRAATRNARDSAEAAHLKAARKTLIDAPHDANSANTKSRSSSLTVVTAPDGMLHLALIKQNDSETRKAETLFPTLHDDIATCVRKGHFEAANRLLREHYHVTYEQPSATCYHLGDLGNRDRHAQYVGVSNLAHKLGLLSVMEYDEENYLTINVYGEKGDIEEFEGRLSRECYVQRLAYRLTKAPKDEWSDPRQDYIVGYFNGMAADEPNAPDITDMRSIGMYDGYMDVNDRGNRDYGR